MNIYEIEDKNNKYGYWEAETKKEALERLKNHIEVNPGKYKNVDFPTMKVKVKFLEPLINKIKVK